MQAAVDDRSCVEVTTMKDPESRTIFAGVDGRTDTELPEWYRQRRDFVVGHLRMAALSVDNELCAVVDPVDDTD